MYHGDVLQCHSVPATLPPTTLSLPSDASSIAASVRGAKTHAGFHFVLKLLCEPEVMLMTHICFVPDPHLLEGLQLPLIERLSSVCAPLAA